MRYCYSTDEEGYKGDFATREEARDAAIEAWLYGQDEEPGYAFTVWTAECHKPDRERFVPDACDLAEFVIEKMNESARADVYDECEWPDVSKEESDALGLLLRATLDAWVKDKCPPVDFWECENVKAHEATVPTSPS